MASVVEEPVTDHESVELCPWIIVWGLELKELMTGLGGGGGGGGVTVTLADAVTEPCGLVAVST
jgi:hypothetical protein